MRGGLFVLALLLLCATTAAGQEWGIGVLDPGVSRPRLVKSVKATQTPEARAAQIQGWVDLRAVVLVDGTVSDVKVNTSCLGRISAHREPNGDPFRCMRPDEKPDPSFGLNQQAANAAQQWVFKPGMKDKRPVAVRILIRMNFDLRDEKTKP